MYDRSAGSRDREREGVRLRTGCRIDRKGGRAGTIYRGRAEAAARNPSRKTSLAPNTKVYGALKTSEGGDRNRKSRRLSWDNGYRCGTHRDGKIGCRWQHRDCSSRGTRVRVAATVDDR